VPAVVLTPAHRIAHVAASILDTNNNCSAVVRESASARWVAPCEGSWLSALGHAATYDLAYGVISNCARAHHDRLGQPGVDAIGALLERELQNLPQTPTHSGSFPGSSADILWNIAQKSRPSAPNPLPL
jgi:hypothetical protein